MTPAERRKLTQLQKKLSKTLTELENFEDQISGLTGKWIGEAALRSSTIGVEIAQAEIAAALEETK